MTDFHEQNGTLYAEELPLNEIAEQFGTPTYVYSTAHIKKQYENLDGALNKAIGKDKKPLLCYACKANSNLAILSLLKSLGSGLEIVSEGELKRGLAAGFDPQTIVSTGVGKQRSEIIACLQNGIHQLNVESLPELEHIQKIAAEIDIQANVVFRLNPNVSGGGHHKISTGRTRDKFGIGLDSIFKAYEMAKDMSHVTAHGLSVHIGSQVFTVETFKEAFEKFPGIVGELRAAGHEVSRLDIGGGFPIQYKDEKLLDLDAYASWVRDIIMPLEAEIILEPGRYLVGNAGVLLSEVLYVKETSDRDFLVIDAAMNDLIRPTLYEAYHGIEAVNNRDHTPRTYDVVGPICETGDTFAQGREITEMQPGDFAVIRSAGAYGMCMASNYNTRGAPAEVLVNGSDTSLIRERETVEDLLKKDIVPDWLKS